MSDLIKQYQNGESILKIAKESKLTAHQVRRRLCKAGVFVPKTKRLNNDGTITCKNCKRNQPLADFPELAHSINACTACLKEKTHKSQLKRNGVSKTEYDKAFQEQDGKCDICQDDKGHMSSSGEPAKLAVNQRSWR